MADALLSAECDYLFRHELVREAAYQLQPPGDRARLHARVVRILQHAGQPPLMELADHALNAARETQDIIAADELARVEADALRQAVELALARFEHQMCLLCLERLVEHPAVAPGERPLLRLERVRAMVRCGHRPEALDAAMNLGTGSDAPVNVLIQAKLEAARIQQDLGNHAGAEELHAQVEQLLADGANDYYRSHLLLSMGQQAMLGGQRNEAAALLQQALFQARRAGDTQRQASILERLANLHRERNEFSKSLEYLDAMDALLPGRSFTARGNLYWRQGLTDEAEAQYLQGLEVARRRGNVAEIAILTGNLGNIEGDRRRFENAARHYAAAAEVCREHGLVALTGIWIMSVGNTRLRQEQLPEALEAYNEALALAREAGDVRHQASITANIGIVLDRTRNAEQALEHYRRAEGLSLSIGDPVGAASHVLRIAELFRDRGEPDAAMECYQRALRLRREGEADESGQDFVLLVGMAAMEQSQGLAASARTHATHARRIADRLGLPRETSGNAVSEAAAKLGQLEQELGIPKSAG
jgi:tetratricopeptide (TPR) repeat protein